MSERIAACADGRMDLPLRGETALALSGCQASHHASVEEEDDSSGDQQGKTPHRRDLPKERVNAATRVVVAY